MAFEALTADQRAQLLLAILDALPDPMFVKNGDHAIIWANRAMLGLTGRDTFTPGRDDDQFPPEQMAVFHATDRKVFAGETSLNEETVGQKMISLTKKSPIRLPDGSTGLVGILFDITSYKAAEASANEARAESAAKSQFLANMSHEIRTPLNGVLGMAQALAQDDLTPEQRAKVDIMLDSSRTLLAVINDVLDLSKATESELEVSAVEVDLPFLLRSMVDMTRARAREKGLDLTLTFDADLPARLRLDPVRVRQCIGHLLANAIKFTDRGEVVMGARVVNGGGGALLEVTVRDTGVGMSKQEQARLFSPFAQVDGSATRKFGGAGLGLAITRKLARLMGGDVSLVSSPGEGSTFTLTLLAHPAILATNKAAALSSESGERPRAELRGKRVLLVDDNPLNRKVVQLFLAPYALQVTEAGDGMEALELLGRTSFDVVLMDIHMPRMDGVEAVRRIRSCGESWSAVPVIALTADALPGDQKRFLDAGMTDYLTKPLASRDLLRSLVMALDTAGGIRGAPSAPLDVRLR
jgi:signal transduction histidine kinase/ActR/RegA family two-component response regulator